MQLKMKIYRTHEGETYNLAQMTPQETQMFYWMMEAYKTAASWEQFQKWTAKKVVDAARRFGKECWEEYYLYKIRFDLLRNVGIRTGELKGELSDIIIEGKKG